MAKIKDIYKQLQTILTPNQKKWGIIVLIMSLIGAIAEMLGVSVIMPLVQAMLEPEKLLEIELVYTIYKKLGFSNSNDLVTLVAFSVVFVYVVKNVYMCVLSYVRVKYSAKVQKELSIYMINSYMGKGYVFFRKTNTSELLRGSNESVRGVYNVLYNGMKIIAEILTIICIIFFIICTDWQMALSIIVLSGAMLVLVLSAFKKMVKIAGEKYYYNINQVNKWSLQLYSGIKEILVLNREDFFVEKYKKSYNEQQKAQVKQTIAQETPAYVIEGICVIGLILVVWIRLGTMDNPANYIPKLASFAVSAFRLLPAIGRISSSVNSIIFFLPSLSDLYENFRETESYKECLNEVKKLERQTIRFNKKMELENITWKYPDGEEYILENVSLVINRGESIAFVGTSGSGKSTLADIILGLYQLERGKLLIDGVDVLTDRNLISNIISFVPQSVYLIDDTIRRNVAFGVEDTEIDEEAVWTALEQAQLKEFINNLPDGLDTVVGERGVRFSGGQMQRLAIARALYTNPEVLVLDEATSALDVETEAAVMEAINSLQGKKTLIIIAHRLSTIKNCDKIFEIAEGKVTQRKYDELV